LVKRKNKIIGVIKMMKDVLLPIGSKVEADIKGVERDEYLIIGKRIINPDTLSPWDYVGVPLSKGLLKTVLKERDGSIEVYENLAYFNHTDIYEDSEKGVDEI